MRNFTLKRNSVGEDIFVPTHLLLMDSHWAHFILTVLDLSQSSEKMFCDMHGKKSYEDKLYSGEG